VLAGTVFASPDEVLAMFLEEADTRLAALKTLGTKAPAAPPPKATGNRVPVPAAAPAATATDDSEHPAAGSADEHEAVPVVAGAGDPGGAAAPRSASPPAAVSQGGDGGDSGRESRSSRAAKARAVPKPLAAQPAVKAGRGKSTDGGATQKKRKGTT
jgi:hypothetical protein